MLWAEPLEWTYVEPKKLRNKMLNRAIAWIEHINWLRKFTTDLCQKVINQVFSETWNLKKRSFRSNLAICSSKMTEVLRNKRKAVLYSFLLKYWHKQQSEIEYFYKYWTNVPNRVNLLKWTWQTGTIIALVRKI